MATRFFGGKGVCWVDLHPGLLTQATADYQHTTHLSLIRDFNAREPKGFLFNCCHYPKTYSPINFLLSLYKTSQLLSAAILNKISILSAYIIHSIFLIYSNSIDRGAKFSPNVWCLNKYLKIVFYSRYNQSKSFNTIICINFC